MKIFFINRYSPKEIVGGSEIQCWLLAKHLAQRGQETAYVALESVAAKRQDEGDGFKVFYLSGQGQSKLKAFFNFLQLLKKERPELCYIRVFTYLFFLERLCRFLKIPMVFNTSHINDLQLPLRETKFSLNPLQMIRRARISIQWRLNFRAMKNINVVTINKEHARILKERGIQAAPIYNSMEDNYEKNRTEKKKRVVWVNNIKPRKRPEYFMDLASRFSASNYEFLMVGNIQSASVYHQKLIEECCERNKNFKYLGGKTPQQVDEILAGASIFVNTCAPEGFGNNFIQAWLNECPTVTFEFDPDGIIEREKIGFCSDGNFEKMADNLRFLMDDEEQRHNMGKRARVYALANHSLANNAARYEEFFKRILRKQ